MKLKELIEMVKEYGWDEDLPVVFQLRNSTYPINEGKEAYNHRLSNDTGVPVILLSNDSLEDFE